MICATRSSSLDVLEWLLENNVALERGGWCYETALIAAAANNAIQALHILLDEDAGENIYLFSVFI